MRRFAHLLAGGVLVIGALFAYPEAEAFGLKTHSWIAREVLQEISAKCQVNVAGRQYKLTEEQCGAIRSHPGHFLSGAMGPDIYPDLVAGQVTTHPGVEGGWQTGDWLRHVVHRAATGEDLAFAMGYLLHAAGDMFAHSYVNVFSGDVFSLADERAVEVRHVAIEKYIDAHLPAGAPNPDSLAISADFLRDTLLYDSSVVDQYKRSGYAPHIVSMYEVRRAVGDFTNALESIEDLSTDLIANYIAAHVELQAKLVTGEAQLEVARETLRLAEQEAAVRRGAYDIAKKAFDDATKAVEDNEVLWAHSDAMYKVETEAIRAAEGAIKDAANALNDLNSRLNKLLNDIQGVPAKVSKKVCDEIRRHCGFLCGFITETICRTVEVANDAYENLNRAINGARESITRETIKHAEATALLATHTAKQAAALKQRVSAESARAGLAAAKAAAEVSYQSHVIPLQAQEKLAYEAREQVSRLEQEVQKVREQIADREKLVAALKSVLDNLNYLSFIGRNWHSGIQRAGTEYMHVGLRVSKHMLKGEGGSLKEYMTWLSCHGSVFLATPYQIAEGACDAKTAYEQVMERIDQIQRALLLPGLREVYDELQKLKAQALQQLQDEVTKATIELVAFVSNDHALAELIRLLEDPSYASRGKVSQVLASAADAGGKPLLTFSNGADLIDADARMANGAWNAEQFNAVKYARIMSRLALLPGAELNDLAGDVAGHWFFDWKLHPTGEPRYSVLFRTLRSIDGNHQWQPFGLPYGRSSGPHQPNPPQRHFGYGPLDGANYGLAMFIDPEARRKVFLKLFPKALSVVEQDARLQVGYPFPSCAAHPFPVTFDATGAPAASDDTCRSFTPATAATVSPK